MAFLVGSAASVAAGLVCGTRGGNVFLLVNRRQLNDVHGL